MNRIVRVLLLVAVVASIAAAALKFMAPPPASVATDSPPPNYQRYLRIVDRTEPPDIFGLPRNIYETVCRLGYPVLVSGWSLEPDTRFVFFEGPFVYQDDPALIPYFYTTLDHPDDERARNQVYVDALDSYRDEARPEELQRFRIPMLKGVPDQLDVLQGLLGEWASEYEQDGKRRLVYDRRLCIGEKLVYGAYFDIQGSAIVKAKGLTTPEDVYKSVHNIKTRPLDDPDPEPLRYAEQPPVKGSAEYALIELILAREAGEREKAMALVSREVPSDFVRESLATSMDGSVPVDPDRLYYQTVTVERERVEIEVSYHLRNGTLFQGKHAMVLEDGFWKALF